MHNFADVCENVTAKNFQESYHDAIQLRDEAMVLFNVGQIGMRERARVEEFFWRTCEKILRITRTPRLRARRPRATSSATWRTRTS